MAAAIDAGAHYLVSTGEPGFIRTVFEHYGLQAARKSVVLLPASGFDWVPGNLAGALALTAAGPDATSVRLFYVLQGAAAESGGAKASAAAAMLEPSFSFREGRLVAERTAARARRVDVGLGLLGGVSHFVPAASAAISAGMRVGPLARGIRSVVTRTSPGSSGGPSKRDRAAGSSVVIAEAMAPDGTCLDRTELRGIEGFTLTAQFLAWAAAQAANGEITGAGALGPVQAFGLDALTEGVAHSGIAVTAGA